jgi:hypothetical protein
MLKKLHVSSYYELHYGVYFFNTHKHAQADMLQIFAFRLFSHNNEPTPDVTQMKYFLSRQNTAYPAKR